MRFKFARCSTFLNGIRGSDAKMTERTPKPRILSNERVALYNLGSNIRKNEEREREINYNSNINSANHKMETSRFLRRLLIKADFGN